eukprot:TRINITY_DN8918_c0_g1_i1.p1 TRINITY_DN8918_c0_g1~~TRINITY_DN8918_c0_g1_i1.p1  ORF type:complete len:581 (-),score=121.66 TRINITY_DN8918_c0_g1_i1:68-1810(-)
MARALPKEPIAAEVRSRSMTGSQGLIVRLPGRGRLVCSSPRRAAPTGGTSNAMHDYAKAEHELADLKEALASERRTSSQLRLELRSAREEIDTLRELLKLAVAGKEENLESPLKPPSSSSPKGQRYQELKAFAEDLGAEKLQAPAEGSARQEEQSGEQAQDDNQDVKMPSCGIDLEQQAEGAPSLAWADPEQSPVAAGNLEAHSEEKLQLSPESRNDKGSYIRASGKVYWLSYEDPLQLVRLPDGSAVKATSSSGTPSSRQHRGSEAQRGEEFPPRLLDTPPRPGQSAQDEEEPLLPGTPEQRRQPLLFGGMRSLPLGQILPEGAPSRCYSARGQLQGHGGMSSSEGREHASDVLRPSSSLTNVPQAGGLVRSHSSGPCRFQRRSHSQSSAPSWPVLHSYGGQAVDQIQLASTASASHLSSLSALGQVRPSHESQPGQVQRRRSVAAPSSSPWTLTAGTSLVARSVSVQGSLSPRAVATVIPGSLSPRGAPAVIAGQAQGSAALTPRGQPLSLVPVSHHPSQMLHHVPLQQPSLSHQPRPQQQQQQKQVQQQLQVQLHQLQMLQAELEHQQAQQKSYQPG